MKYRLHEIKLPLSYSQQDVKQAVLTVTGLQPRELQQVTVIRRSLDARQEPKYNLIIEISSTAAPRCSRKNFTEIHNGKNPDPIPRSSGLRSPATAPVIIGAGPAGLMAALTLAENGLKPHIYEQGERAEKRAWSIHQYLEEGLLNQASNILSGEGGAGLWSDGKLTSRHKNRRLIRRFFTALVACGAPDSILIDAEPHLGSDRLLKIIPGLREKISSLGGTFHFNAEVTDLQIEQGIFRGIRVGSTSVSADYGIIAAGHSARKLYKILANAGTALEPKPFAVGVRLEIPQDIINRSRYGRHADFPGLGPASFRLTRKPEKGIRACYTFCMCPGGQVLPCASSPGEITSNGMSLSTRAGSWGNAAFLVPVTREDFSSVGTSSPAVLQGCSFQEAIETAAFTEGGKDFSLPAARLTDFLNESASTGIYHTISCKRARAGAVHRILPAPVTQTLMRAIPPMLGRFSNLDLESVTVYGAETRSSSPVRILRDDQTGMSVNTLNLFPAGEGSGYAGGIVSSAIDGITAATALIRIMSAD